MTAYRSRPLTVEAVQWTGANLDEIREFAGPDFIDVNGERVWIRNTEGPFEIHPGYWISRQPGMPLILHSPAAWDRIYQPEGDPT
jgi:hypothetical protein